jgi:circadian clock protein KaiC
MAIAGSVSKRQDAWVSSGIEGLDALLTGGFTPHRMYLVEGNPGTGKTTLAMQFLLEGKQRGEATLYVTLSETSAELQAVAASHGWSLEGIEIFQLAASEAVSSEDQYTLYHPAEVELGETMKAVLAVVERVRPARVVLDSLSELKLLARDPLRFRRQILALKEFFAGREATVLLLDDHSTGPADLQLQSLSHGVVLLEQLPIDYGRARRRLRVVKFRGVAAVEGFHDFVIRRGGLIVFPQLTVGTSSVVRFLDDVHSGLAELDDLLGGGLTWGTTTVIIGPPGTGKSTLGAQFVAACAETAPAAVFLFDERVATFTARCDALAMRISDRLAKGQIRIEQIEPGELSPGEFSYRVREAVETRGARVIFVDSINGYLNAIPQSDTPLARMHELLSFLNERNVATVVTVAQHGIIGTTMATPLDLSYLADSILLLRFFEAHGAVRRAISVVKKRTGVHESTIRELEIGPDRLRVGAALTDFQGVLTGVPQYTGGAGPLQHDADGR